MNIEIIALIGLVLVLVVTLIANINMGVVAFVATFAVAFLFADIPIESAIVDGFPTDLFVTIVGVTYLFGIARENGTIAWLIDLGTALVRGRLWLMPWVFFAIAGLLSMTGAPIVAAIAVLAPVALEFSRRYGLHPLLMGLMVINGAAAGGFAPTSVLGVIAREVADRGDVELGVNALFLGNGGINILLGIVGYLLFGGRQLFRLSRRGSGALGPQGQTTSSDAGDYSEGSEASIGASSLSAPARGLSTLHVDGTRSKLSLQKTATLIVLLCLMVGGMGFDMDVGVLSLSAAVFLSLLSPSIGRKATGAIAWGTVLLVSGTLTYVALLQEVGTIDFLSHAVIAIGIPALGILLICMVGALGSAVASTIGIIGALLPIVVPLVTQSGLDSTAVISALAISSLVVDASPLSSTGALVVANSPEERRESVFRQLLLWGGSMIVIAPLVTWLVFILPS